MRRASRLDDNHGDVVRALRSMGMSVQSLAAVGRGCPDLLVGRRGENWLFEVKDGDKVPSAQKLTPSEVEWHQLWRGQVGIIRSIEDVIAWAALTT